jgi:hypothetical protein
MSLVDFKILKKIPILVSSYIACIPIADLIIISKIFSKNIIRSAKLKHDFMFILIFFSSSSSNSINVIPVVSFLSLCSSFLKKGKKSLIPRSYTLTIISNNHNIKQMKSISYKFFKSLSEIK